MGSVGEDALGIVSDAVSSAVADLVDFPTALEGLGAFPSPRRARVIWSGLADAAGGIVDLAASVRSALAHAGFSQEDRPFHPHVTLARLRTAAAVRLDEPVAPIRFAVERVTVFASTLGRPHARYTAVATFPFRRPLTPPRDEGP